MGGTFRFSIMALKLSSIVEYLVLSAMFYIFVLSRLLRTYLPFHILESQESSYQSFEKTDSLVIPDPDLVCDPHNYNVHILSREPLVLYIEGFLSQDECEHLINVSNGHYTQSTVFTGTDELFDPSIRNSSKALLPRDHIVQCIETRAREFQGWKPDVYIERLWSQRYEPGGHYVHHFDWSGDIVRYGAGRVSTFMVYLDDKCTGGGTEFPRLKGPSGKEWCEFIHCYDNENDESHEEEVTGVVFKPLRGNAVYWENFRSDGRGFEETWHAGMPVKSGIKVGLNIWSWYQPGYADNAINQGSIEHEDL